MHRRHCPNRGNMDLQALDFNLRHVTWSHQEIDIVGPNDKFLHGSKRRRTRRTTRPDKRTAFRDAAGMRKNSYVEVVKANGPVKVFLQGFDHPLTGEWPMGSQQNQASHE